MWAPGGVWMHFWGRKKHFCPTSASCFLLPESFRRSSSPPVNLYQTLDTPFSETATVTLHPLRSVQIMSLPRMSHKWPSTRHTAAFLNLDLVFQRSLLLPLHFRSHLGDVFDSHGWIWMISQVESVQQTTLNFYFIHLPTSLFKITFSLCQYFSSMGRACSVTGRSFTVQSNIDKLMPEMPHFSKPWDWSPLLCKTQLQVKYEQQNIFFFSLHSQNQYQINDRTILSPILIPCNTSCSFLTSFGEISGMERALNWESAFRIPFWLHL